MVDPIPAGVRETWEEWKIKGPILASLYIQIMLVLIAPFRKRTGHKLVVAAVWSFYLLADGVALFALGQIFNVDQETGGGGGDCSSPANNKNNEFGDLAVLWGTFLLVHLGGPDTITAFSIADTQLWLRHFLQMIVQAVATLYLILLTLPSNKVVGPTVLLFIVGIVKYSERCLSLYLACRREIGKWVLSSTEFERLVLFDTTLSAAGRGFGVQRVPSSMTLRLAIVSEALKFRGGSGDLENYQNTTDALRITEVVMNMIYDNVFSKGLVLHSGVWGYTFRFLTFSSTLAALSIFHFKEHHHYNNNNNGLRSDVGFTYVLLGGAILLEFYSILMIIFSDSTFARFISLKNNNRFITCVGRCCGTKFLLPALRLLVRLKMWDDDHKDCPTCRVFVFRTEHKHRPTCGVYVFSRWSRHVSRYKLTRVTSSAAAAATNTSRAVIRAAAVRPFAAVKDKFFKAEYDEWKYVSREPLTYPLWAFIFHLLRKKIDYKPKPPNFKLLSGGSLALNNQYDSYLRVDDPFIKLVMEDFNYGRNLLIWSIATDLLFNNDDSASSSSDENNNNARCFSKTLSDYMLYLLVVRQLWPLGNLKPQFLELCGDNFHERRRAHGVKDDQGRLRTPPDIKDLDGPSTTLFECGDKLAGILMVAAGERGGGGWERMWEIVGSVWVEKLWLGARKCSANTHIELLSRGGELLTLVWLLSAKLDPDSTWSTA